ncbi:gastrula zinc finger protein XlCGF67.1-like [Clytia hemisphaerica]|uniref:gastrula zinc finger protein XlCGF67.1-like n=1 Tax=Clytia hemisphaerica TaxID=252671 RepID=UPI0034D74E3F
MAICFFCGEEISMDEKESHILKHKPEDDGSAGCHMCEKRFRGNYELKCHVKVVHKGELWKCTKCPKEFKSKNGLTYHNKSVHKMGKLLHCDSCECSFPSQQKLLFHQRKDHGKKPLLCRTCNTCFVYPWLFKKHKLNCKEKPGRDVRIWLCRYCFKSYKTLKYKEIHQNKCESRR